MPKSRRGLNGTSLSYNLMLSPHPDDLVFSCFSALSFPKIERRAIVFFNSSRFSRWPIRSEKLVSTYRTLEDSFVLNTLGVNVTYLFEKDSSINNPSTVTPKVWNMRLDRPARIYCPLGIGNNRNHLEVRDWAIKRWLGWKKSCELFFYEDLPYAGKIEGSLTETESAIIKSLEPVCGRLIDLRLEPLSADTLARKLFFSKMYYSQTDYSGLLERFAKLRGRKLESGFAEAVFRVRLPEKQ
jgi:hypothetical protein